MVQQGQRLSLLVAARIEARRQEAGLSLDALAATTGLHPTSIGLIVRGKRGMTIATASALSCALGVPLSQLIAEAENDASN